MSAPRLLTPEPGRFGAPAEPCEKGHKRKAPVVRGIGSSLDFLDCFDLRRDLGRGVLRRPKCLGAACTAST